MDNTGLKENIFPNESEIPSEYRLNQFYEQNAYLMGGELTYWPGKLQSVYSPICAIEKGKLQQTLIGKYPLMDQQSALGVLNAALESFDHGRGAWAQMSIEKRIGYLENFKEKFQKKKNEIVLLLMWEIGKSYLDSLNEFDRTVQNLQDTIKEMRKINDESCHLQHHGHIISQIIRRPLGVVLCMGPYNFPLNESFATLIPAVAMGNSVIFKPPRHGVLLHYPLLELFRECFPPGVINTLYGAGEEVIEPVLRTGKVDVLAFIGSSQVANKLRSYHPSPNRLVNILGLEAKNPAVVLPDADIDHAVQECLAGALSFNGQRCTALKILYVHSSIVHEFNRQFCNKVDAFKAGMPWEEDAFITPLPEKDRIDYLKGLLMDALDERAKILNKTGGRIHGSLFYPTVLFPVNKHMKLFHEEQFGPLVPIVPFDDIREPEDYIIQSKYGQQASIFGKDIQMIRNFSANIANQVARININSLCQRGPDTLPFTGRKDSAKATLSVFDGLRVFSLRCVLAGKGMSENSQIIQRIINPE
jgi:glyceraldehyde-3-phosphate dehydrogenase (NADP+)